MASRNMASRNMASRNMGSCRQAWRIAGIIRKTAVVSLLAVLAFVLLPVALPAQAGGEPFGGPRGPGKSAKGGLLEGIIGQLIAEKSAIRTTVFSNEDGRYEFPRLAAGSYTLRIAQPREFHPYVRETVAIDGATELPDITLTRLTGGEVLPPTPEIAAQMTGSEWLASLSG